MQQKLSDYRQQAPDVDWAAVEKAVRTERQVQQQRRAATMVAWRRLAVAAAAALLLGFWFWQQGDKMLTRYEALQAHYEAQQTLNDAQPLRSPKGEGTGVGTVSPSPHNIGSDSLSLSNHSVPHPRSSKGVERLCHSKPTTSKSTSGKPDNKPETAVQNYQPAETATRKDTLTKAMSRNDTPSNTIVVLPPSPAFHHVTAKPNRLTAKVYFSNGMEGSRTSDYFLSQLPISNKNGQWNNHGNGNGDGNEGGELSFGDDRTGVSNNEGDDDGNDDNDDSDGSSARRFTRATPADDNQPVETLRNDEQTHHRQPLRFGLSLRYRLNNRWSLESGFFLTFHSSELTSTTIAPENPSQPLESCHADQNLTYIGIPLHANYQLWGNRRFSVYATAGGAVEKMIRGRQNVETRRAGQLQEQYERSVTIHPLQLSLDGGVGAEYKFADHFSLFAEPTIGYYFDNGSAVSTIYQDQPLNFNLNVGLRLSLR